MQVEVIEFTISQLQKRVLTSKVISVHCYYIQNLDFTKHYSSGVVKPPEALHFG